MVKKILIVLVILLCVSTSFSMVTSGMKIWPGKFDIEIIQWGEKTDEISHKIHVTNPENTGMYVVARVEHPAIEAIDDGYSFIPSLSWVEVTPESLYIPPKSSADFTFIIRVPENKKELHYNEKWDVRVVISSDQQSSSGSYTFNIELATKLLVVTPEGKASSSQNMPILIVFFAIAGLICLIVFYWGKRNRKREAVFYFKKDKKK